MSLEQVLFHLVPQLPHRLDRMTERAWAGRLQQALDSWSGGRGEWWTKLGQDVYNEAVKGKKIEARKMQQCRR